MNILRWKTSFLDDNKKSLYKNYYAQLPTFLNKKKKNDIFNNYRVVGNLICTIDR